MVGSTKAKWVWPKATWLLLAGAPLPPPLPVSGPMVSEDKNFGPATNELEFLKVMMTAHWSLALPVDCGTLKVAERLPGVATEMPKPVTLAMVVGEPLDVTLRT